MAQPEEHHRLLLVVDLELKELFLLFILLHQQVVVLLVLEEVQDLKMVDLVVVEAVMEYKEHRLLEAHQAGTGTGHGRRARHALFLSQSFRARRK